VPWDDDAARLLGRRVRRLREGLVLSQEALAHRAGCSKNHVQLIEAAGRRAPARPVNLRLTTLYGLADALGVTPWDLVRDPDPGG
jgi:transcriptional regulator with XRE-family HTH domain